MAFNSNAERSSAVCIRLQRINLLTYFLCGACSWAAIKRTSHTPSIAFQHLPPRKGHSLSPLSVYRRWQCSPKSLGIDKTVEATKRPSTHENMKRVRSGRERKKRKKKKKKEDKKRVPSRFKQFWFHLCWRKQRGRLEKERPV